MNVHQNARLTPHSRADLVRRVVVEGQTVTAVAAAFGVTVKTVRKWVARFQTEGVKGLRDRSSRPHHLHRPTPAATVATIEALRRQRWTGQHIAAAVGVSPATISRILRRLGLNRIQALEPATPVRRYEREHPGELIHSDIKKLGRFDCVGHRITGDRTSQSKRRGVGWEFVHICIDDASRVAFSQIRPDEKKERAFAFLKATVAYYANLGVTITRVMTDNGSCYRSKAFRSACRDLGLKHIRTKPYTPALYASPIRQPYTPALYASPIRPRQTARPSALSRPPCANGPTLRPTPPRITAPVRCRSGCTDTTGTGRIAV